MLLHPLIEEWDTDLRSADPLGFPGYAEKLRSTEGESVRTGCCEHYVLIESDFSVFGGSMGVVHGEKVVRAIDRAISLRLPIVAVTRSGGARMQEGMISLIQLGRTAAAMGRHRDAGLLSVGVLRSPTTGGVFASYGSLCDLLAVEEEATIGFAGPRVAAQVTGRVVDGASHTAEAAFAAGMVDAIGDEDALRQWVYTALGVSETPLPARETFAGTQPSQHDVAETEAPQAVDSPSRSAWAEVVASRRRDRPTGIDVATALVTSWTELRGDDPVVRVGLATQRGQRIVVVAHDRHHGTGRPTPAGFRLAQRGFALANRLGVPIVTLIDTPGAEPGSEAELDGIAGEIAATLLALESVGVPTVGVCVGEGGSGGALALGVTDRLLIQEHATFSVIGAEGAAVILHRDAARAPEVAEHLALTSADLLRLGVVDEIVPDDVAATGAAIDGALQNAIIGDRLTRMDRASAPWVRVVKQKK